MVIFFWEIKILMEEWLLHFMFFYIWISLLIQCILLLHDMPWSHYSWENSLIFFSFFSFFFVFIFLFAINELMIEESGAVILFITSTEKIKRNNFPVGLKLFLKDQIHFSPVKTSNNLWKIFNLGNTKRWKLDISVLELQKRTTS